MSSCGDCGTDEGGCGSCGPSRPVQAPKTLPGLIQFGLEHWNEESYSDPYKAKHWDLLFNEIGVNLAKKNAQSTKPLLTVFSEQGPRAFLQLAQQLLLLELEGKLIWWAFEFCLEDPTEFVKQINNRNPTLLRYAHQQANIYSCFPGNEKVSFDFEKASSIPVASSSEQQKRAKAVPGAPTSIATTTAASMAQALNLDARSFVIQFSICFVVLLMGARILEVGLSV